MGITREGDLKDLALKHEMQFLEKDPLAVLLFSVCHSREDKEGPLAQALLPQPRGTTLDVGGVRDVISGRVTRSCSSPVCTTLKWLCPAQLFPQETVLWGPLRDACRILPLECMRLCSSLDRSEEFKLPSQLGRY